MDLAGIDRNLAGLRGMISVMSANLVDLEGDAIRARLDQAALAGTTAQRWAEARRSLECLWQWFRQLNAVLDQATQVRGTKTRLDPDQMVVLDGLLNGPSVELSTAGIPLAERGLFGPSETTTRCSPAQLLDRMRAAFDQAVAVIRSCDQKWATIEARLGPLGEKLASAELLAAALGERHRPELVWAHAELDRLRQAVMCDPLAAPDDAAPGIAATVDSATAELQQLAALRDSMTTRLAEARVLLAELQRTVHEATAARAEVLTKIARPAAVDPPSMGADIEEMLARVAAASARGEWRAAANQLALWTTRCGDALREARAALAANQAPIAARDELRGRLDAYRAKAHRMGLLEDARVAGLYARARRVLFTAPTDLTEAEQVVLRYQQALTGPAPQEATT